MNDPDTEGFHHTIDDVEAQFEGQDTSKPAVVTPCQFDGASLQSVTSAESESMEDTFPSSPATTDLSTSVSSLGTDNSNSYSHSPTTAAAGSPTLPATQNPAADAIRCHQCGQIFKADKSNLRRHLRFLHGDGSRYLCLEPGCTKSFSRPDNLSGHVRKNHGAHTHTSAAAGAMK